MAKNKLFISLINGIITASLLMGSGISALASNTNTEKSNTFIARELEFKTTDKDGDGSGYFTNTITENGKTYTISSITQEITDQEEVKGDYYIYTSPAFVDETFVKKPEETMEYNGVIYTLKDTNLVNARVEDRVQYVEDILTFNNIEDLSEIPQTAKIDVTDNSSGQKITTTAPFIKVSKHENVWSDDFEFPIVISGYDADYFMLGDTKISKNDDLMNYSKEFLNYLGLPSDRYKINEIKWNGKAYTSNGELCRKAIASGEKLTYNIEALYGGDVSLPAADGKRYECTYVSSENPDSVIYTIKATAEYKENPAIETESEQTPLEKLIDWIKANPILAFGIGTIVILFFGVIIIFILSQKKKEKNDKKPYEIIDIEKK